MAISLPSNSNVPLNEAFERLLREAGVNAGALVVDLYSGLAQSSKSVLMYGATATAATDTTEYVLPGYSGVSSADEIGFIMPVAGELSMLQLKAATGPAGASCVLTVRVNGVASTLTATLAIAGTSASDVTHTVTVAAGDEVTLQVNPGAAISAGAAKLRASVQFKSL